MSEKYKTVMIPKERMKNVLWGDEENSKVIEDEIVDHTRWSVIHSLVFELDGQTYSTSYSRGATEYQEEQPWEYDGDEIKVYPVTKETKTVTVWKQIPCV